MKPRIVPATPSDPEVQQQLAKGFQHRGAPLNAASTLAHHPRLLKRFTVFAGLFLTGSTLPERDREIVTLRCAHRFGCDYYFGHHTVLAAHLLTPAEIAATTGPSTAWIGFERLLVESVDEVCESWELSDASWERLAGDYARDQLLELVMLIGFYRMTCLYVNTIGIQREPGIPGWPDERNSQ